jgi:hypothetical protein
MIQHLHLVLIITLFRLPVQCLLLPRILKSIVSARVHV